MASINCADIPFGVRKIAPGCDLRHLKGGKAHTDSNIGKCLKTALSGVLILLLFASSAHASAQTDIWIMRDLYELRAKHKEKKHVKKSKEDREYCTHHRTKHSAWGWVASHYLFVR